MAAVCLASAGQAATRTDYDPVLKKWVTYDTKSLGFYHGGGSSVPREMINYDGPYGPNTIVINTDERRLYFVYAKGKAIKYGIGVGREGFQWAGTDTISNKAEWPGWTPPPEMIVRERAKGRILPNYMAGGLNNPLGARALYIGGRIYRIHGSNEPWTIGHAVSSGCIRLTNDDVVDLYDRVPVGTRVVVLLSTQPQNEDAVASAGPRDKPILPNAVVKTRLPVKAPAAPVFAVKASAKVIDLGKSADNPVLVAKDAAKAGCRDEGAGHRGEGDGRAGTGAESCRAGDRGESVRQRRRQSVSACRGGGAGHDRAQEAARPARDGDAQGRAGRHHARGDRSAQRGPRGRRYPAKAAADG